MGGSLMMIHKCESRRLRTNRLRDIETRRWRYKDRGFSGRRRGREMRIGRGTLQFVRPLIKRDTAAASEPSAFDADLVPASCVCLLERAGGVRVCACV